MRMPEHNRPATPSRQSPDDPEPHWHDANALQSARDQVVETHVEVDQRASPPGLRVPTATKDPIARPRCWQA
jgi:hypothetical protein